MFTYSFFRSLDVVVAFMHFWFDNSGPVVVIFNFVCSHFNFRWCCCQIWLIPSFNRSLQRWQCYCNFRINSYGSEYEQEKMKQLAHNQIKSQLIQEIRFEFGTFFPRSFACFLLLRLCWRVLSMLQKMLFFPFAFIHSVEFISVFLPSKQCRTILMRRNML